MSETIRTEKVHWPEWVLRTALRGTEDAGLFIMSIIGLKKSNPNRSKLELL